MELTKEEKRIAVAAYRKDSVSADPHAEVYAACEAVLESRAASDQGLRKAAQEAITKIESIAPMIDSVVFLPSPANTPWDILGLLPCAQALKAALARQTQDGPVIGDEQPPYKKCGKVAQTFIAREGSFFTCALEEGHEGPCLQSGTCFRHGVYFGKNCPHWPKCADQLLAPRREPSHPMSGTMQDEVRVTDRPQETSQQEADTCQELLARIRAFLTQDGKGRERVTDPAVEAVMDLPELNGWDEVARRSAATRIVEKVRKADAQGDNKACITVSNEEYLALERVAREMQEALVARQEADATWKNDRTAHNVCHEMTKKADDLARTALAAFDKAKECK